MEGEMVEKGIEEIGEGNCGRNTEMMEKREKDE